MKLLLTTLLLLAFAALPANAHSLKRNCIWGGNNIFRDIMCRDGNSQPRATPSRSVRPSPPDKPSYDCKGDDKGKGHGKGHDKD